ncbi:MAG TPA: hypothetical protein VNP73_07265, partial [Actinomycetota bacterium]|nr:hypothetical protein [Actinomycetota bacterium]
AKNLWVVGSNSFRTTSTAFVARFDGREWNEVDPPPLGTAQRFRREYLGDVSVLASNDVWVTGAEVFTEKGPDADRSVLAHWDGSTWDVEYEIEGGSLDIDMLSPTEGWAVGTVYEESESGDVYSSDGLILHYEC